MERKKVCYHRDTYSYFILHPSSFMLHLQKGKRGFITAIILIVVALIVLGFFGFNLKSIVNSPTVEANLSYV